MTTRSSSSGRTEHVEYTIRLADGTKYISDSGFDRRLRRTLESVLNHLQLEGGKLVQAFRFCIRLFYYVWTVLEDILASTGNVALSSSR